MPEDEQSFPESLGEIVRRQRELSELSMRQFAALAGISNPYLSQIERGLREPSEQVAEAIAKVLQTSAAALYKEAGIDEQQPESGVCRRDRSRPRPDAASTPGAAHDLRRVRARQRRSSPPPAPAARPR